MINTNNYDNCNKIMFDIIILYQKYRIKAYGSKSYYFVVIYTYIETIPPLPQDLYYIINANTIETCKVSLSRLGMYNLWI